MRIDLPGDEWADIKPVEDLTGADQDFYLDALDAARARREAEDAPDRTANKDYRAVRDQVMGKLITGWSLDAPLPYTSATRTSLPLYVCNALFDAIDEHVDALNGNGPKAEKSGTGSADTSPDSTLSLPLEPLPAA
jgi:hypothetical protein